MMKKNAAWVLVLSVCMVSLATAGIYVQPYLQNPKSDGMTIVWWTDESQPSSQVEYGLGDYNTVVAATNEQVQVTTPFTFNKFVHMATITGLSAETTYTYRVRSGSFLSNAYTFKTSPLATSSYHFAILGDGRTDTATIRRDHRKVTKQAELEGASLIFEAGDMVYSGVGTHWDWFYRSVITTTNTTEPGVDTGSKIPFLTAIGNHEIYNEYSGGYGGGLNDSMLLYRKFEENPDNGAANANWKERYYVVKYGCATFIVLDTNNTSSNTYDNHDLLADGTTPDWEPGSEQYNWMVAQLQEAQNHGAFTFVIMHPAPYSRGVHGTDSATIDTQRGYQVRALDPIFRQYGVDAVFTSHDHIVEHCLTGPTGFHTALILQDANNLIWFVQGSSGEGARTAHASFAQWMDILGNNAAPYYTTWYYTWENTAYRSFMDVALTNLGSGNWQATFRTVRIDPSLTTPVSAYYDTFSLTRSAKCYLQSAVNLQNYNPGPNGRLATVELRQGGSLIRTDNVTLNSSGGFTLTGVPAGTYDVRVSVPGFLASTAGGVAVNTDTTISPNFDLVNGDIDSDNEIASTDLAIVLSALDIAPPDLGADLNGDGLVNSDDLVILLTNMDKTGSL